MNDLLPFLGCLALLLLKKRWHKQQKHCQPLTPLASETPHIVIL